MTVALLLVLAWLVMVTPTEAGVSADCSQANLQTAVDAASDGDTITITTPGPATYTTYLHLNQKHVIVNMTGCTISDNVPKSGGQYSGWLRMTVKNTSTLMRVYGFTQIAITSDSNNKGHIVVEGNGGGNANWRIDNFTITSAGTSIVRTYGYTMGVIDHCSGTFHKLLLEAGHQTWNNTGAYGDASWADDRNPGTNGAIYVEDCTLTATSDPFVQNYMDGHFGARVVFRFNTLTQGNTTSHGADSGQRERGMYHQEIYGNNYIFPPGMAVDFLMWFRGGGGFVHSNIGTLCPSGCAGGGWFNSLAKHTNQRDTASFTPWGQCDGTGLYDGNESGETGHICVDQCGAGKGADLGGNVTPIAVAHALDPAYVVNNRITFKGSTVLYGELEPNSSGNVENNRDIYYENASFTGATGVGRGVIASRPATCTTGVAYWATDEGSWNAGTNANYTGQGRLYKCTATDTWTLWYTPYTYPHPLIAGSPVTVRPGITIRGGVTIR